MSEPHDDAGSQDGAGARRARRLHARARRVLEQLAELEHGYRDGWVPTSGIRGTDRQALWSTLQSLYERGFLERRPTDRPRRYDHHITPAGREALALHHSLFRRRD